MKQSRLRAVGALAAVAALAAPAAANAHPSVLEGTAKVVVPNSDPVTVTDETQYFVTNHGFSFVFRESNGATDLGVVSYKLLPSAYRRGLTRDQILAQGDTGVQAHATCRGVAALSSTEAIYAWQGADPFYDYVPFQTTSAGLEDDPATWLAVIRARTGVDLATAADVRAECTRLGGTYTAADAIVSRPEALSSGPLGEATTPLRTQIDDLTRAKAAADAAVTALTGEKDGLTRLLAAARAQIASLIAAAKPLTATLEQKTATGKSVAKSGTAVKLTGPAAAKVKVSLSIGELRAKALGLRSTVLASTTATLGADGAARVTLKPTKAAAKALKALRGKLAFTVSATSGDRAATVRGSVK